ncbi:MAG: rod shape-determining protein MreD [Actinomycetes bacterium]
MLTRRFAWCALIYIFFYFLQMSVVDQIKFPFGSLSLFLLFVLSWSALSSPEIGALLGFAGGLLLDLSLNSTGPFGLWTLILSLIGFGIAFLRYGDEGAIANPFVFIIYVSVAVMLTLIAYLLLGMLFGVDIGSTAQIVRNILGSGFWSLIFMPIFLPFTSRLHRLAFDTRERI